MRVLFINSSILLDLALVLGKDTNELWQFNVTLEIN